MTRPWREDGEDSVGREGQEGQGVGHAAAAAAAGAGQGPTGGQTRPGLALGGLAAADKEPGLYLTCK